MKNAYDDTIKYWDNIFGQETEYNPTELIPVEDLENGVIWISENTKSTIDFGCGNGRFLLRCLDRGVDYVYGIDICNNAIETAKNVIEKYNYKDKAEVICGGINKLNEIDDNSYESAILFNILDNLTPEDSTEVIRNIHRIIKPNGKILLKLNPYIPEQQRKEYKFKEISNEFYKEDSGLYLWNLTNEMVEKIIEPFFTIEKYEEVEYKQYNMINRMYYLKNR